MKNPKFSVIIANFNGKEYITDCLSSVFKTDYSSVEIIIVEDGSIDGSLEVIKKFQNRYNFQLIQNDKNLGLVASRNKAIKKASGEILVFLDNDTQVDKNWLKGLAEVFSTDTLVGAAQCKIFDFKNRNTIQEIGMKLIPFTGFGTPLGRGQKDYGQFDEKAEIIALGAALAVKREIAKKIDGFDQKLFHYSDDLDFSWRIWISGHRIVLAPRAHVYHYTKIHNLSYKLYYHLCKNSLRMIIKNYEIYNVIKFLPASLLFNIAGGLFVLFTRRNISAVLGVLLGIVWSICAIKDTLQERAKVQRLRKIPDSEIFTKIMVPGNILSIHRQYFRTARKTVA